MYCQVQKGLAMTAQASSVLGNVGPPSYLVKIPPDSVLWYQYAPALFLSLSLVLFGWWIARSRALRQGRDRAMLIACAGSLAVSYSAWWIWQHRDSGMLERDFEAILAVELPWLWIQFCLVVFLLVRVYLHNNRRSETGAQVNAGPSPWRNDVLAILLACGTAIPIALAGHHALFLPFMFLCWVLAFITWSVLGLLAWVMRRSTPSSAPAKQASAL